MAFARRRSEFRLVFRHVFRLALGLAFAAFPAFQPTAAAPPVSTPPPTYEKEIRPLLAARCGNCHGANVRKGGLSVATLEGLRRGGESGESAVAEAWEESLLWVMIDGGEMPPAGEPPVTAEERATIQRWLSSGEPFGAGGESVTQHDVLPYLFTRCVACHGGRRREAGLDLRSVESILKGGESGPAVVPGRPRESLLLRRVHAREMPPPRELIRAGVRPLEPAEVQRIEQWVEQGALRSDLEPSVQTAVPDPLVSDADRQHWAFQPPRAAPVPEVAPPPGGAEAATPIDAFLLRKLRERSLEFSPPADRATLVRRVAFDLTGLPPRWEDLQRFVNDARPDWYAKMVDEYLESPHYGERWARHWLDLAGYADSEGKRSADPIRPHAWRYRDYVIRALNDDRPYDQFLVEQLAGDELHDWESAAAVTPEMMDAVVATGFLRMAPDGTGSDIVDTVEERFEVVADELEVLGSAVLGLTLRCAQCHSHKYDPIPQRDYYRLVAVFAGAYDVYDWLKPTSVAGQSKQANPTRRYLPLVTADARAQWEAERRPLQAQIDAATQRLDEARTAAREAAREAQLADLPAPLQNRLRQMLQTPAAKRTEAQRALAEEYEEKLAFRDKRLLELNPQLKRLTAKIEAEIKGLESQLPPEPQVRALWDRGDASPTWVFRRGRFDNPGEPVGPGVLSVLTDGRTPFVPQPQRPGSTGRRLALARWLTQPQHPLTARVMVNRVWHRHFGRGIVETLGNFGRAGAPPTHPELLDYLAVEFVERGWRLKWLHRQMLNTAAYRQSSRLTDRGQQLDPGNALLSRMPLRRLDAESVRDSLLFVSGRLDPTPFGQGDGVTVRDDGLVTSNATDRGWRRTIYVRQRRKEVPTILETFDLPQMIPNCVERPSSLVAPQALHLLNNGMVRELAEAFAARVAREAPGGVDSQVERACQLALGRMPSEEERRAACDAIEALTQAWRRAATRSPPRETGETPAPPPAPAARALTNYCHVLLNSAEFLFLD